MNISKSPWVLHYDGSSCNGCDIEVLATMTPLYDVERFGIINTGNPKHADVLLLTKEELREITSCVPACFTLVTSILYRFIISCLLVAA